MFGGWCPTIFTFFIKFIKLLIDLNSIPYIKTLMVVCSPVGFCCLLFLFWIAYKFYKKLDFCVMIENFLITAAITFFYFQAPVINALAGMLNCSEIENDSYMNEYLLEKCTNNPRYTFWKNRLVFPALGFFVLILPIWPLYYMRQNKQNLFNKDVIYKIGFLLNGYSPEAFYW